MDQIPRLADLLAPAVTALLGDLTGDRRAARERHANAGRFGDVIRGWRGQAEVVRARLTKEVLSARLDSSAGQELKDLGKSEYFAELPSEPRKAVGEATLRRTVINGVADGTGVFTVGVIPAGTRIKRTLEAAPRVPAEDSEFLTTETVPCSADSTGGTSLGDGTFRHQQSVVVPLEATREGPHANLPRIYLPLPLVAATVAGALFYTFEVTYITASGGTLGVADAQLRALSRALSTGSNGPTRLAVIAGALTNTGVRKAVYVDDPTNARARLYVCDESWASSNRYRERLLQDLRAFPWIGWGCMLSLFRVLNVGIVVRPTILLRSPEYVTAESDITANIVAALKRYFDDRPDWYTWTLNGIGGAAAGADDRILACTAVAVLDADGFSLAAVDEAGTVTGSEPTAEIAPTEQKALHWVLIDDGARPIYQVPSGA